MDQSVEKSPIKDKMSLPEMLNLMDDVDRGMVNLSLPEMAELGEKSKIKIDHYKQFLDRCDSEVERLSKQAMQLADAAASIKRTKARLEDMLMYTMANNCLTKMPGDLYNVKLVTLKDSKTVNKTNLKPGPKEFIKWEHKGFVTVSKSYKWQLTNIKNMLKGGAASDVELTDLFCLEDSIKIKWDVKKDITK